MATLQTKFYESQLEMETDDESDLSDPEDEVIAQNLMSYVRHKRHGSEKGSEPAKKKSRNTVNLSSKSTAVHLGIPPIRIPRGRCQITGFNEPQRDKEASKPSGLFNAGKQIFSWALTKFWDPNSPLAPIFEQNFPKDKEVPSVSTLTEKGDSDSDSDENESTVDVSNLSTLKLDSLQRYNLRRRPLDSSTDSIITNDSDISDSSQYLTPEKSLLARHHAPHPPTCSEPAKSTTKGILSPRKGVSNYKARVRVSINRTPKIREIANRQDQAVDGSLVWAHRDLAPHECEQFRSDSSDASLDNQISQKGENLSDIPDSFNHSLRLSFSSTSSEDKSPSSAISPSAILNKTRSSSTAFSPRSEAANLLIQFQEQEMIFQSRTSSSVAVSNQSPKFSLLKSVPSLSDKSKIIQRSQSSGSQGKNKGPVTKEVKLPRLMPRRVKREPVAELAKPTLDDATRERLRSCICLDDLLTVKRFSQPWLPPVVESWDMDYESDEILDQSEPWEDDSTDEEESYGNMHEGVDSDSIQCSGTPVQLLVNPCPPTPIETRKRLSFNGAMIDLEEPASPSENASLATGICKDELNDCQPETEVADSLQCPESTQNEIVQSFSKADGSSIFTPWDNVDREVVLNDQPIEISRPIVQSRKPLTSFSPLDIAPIVKKYEHKIIERIASTRVLSTPEHTKLEETRSTQPMPMDTNDEKLEKLVTAEIGGNILNDENIDKSKTTSSVKSSISTKVNLSQEPVLRRSERNRAKKNPK